MLSFTKIYFWWPNINHDVEEYVSACSTCARNKSGNQPPVRLLHPPHTPGCTWSYISLNFITGLPSEGKTVILTIIDRFSKAARFIPLEKPTLIAKLLSSWCYMCFISMESPQMFQIEDLNSSQKCKRLSV